MGEGSEARLGGQCSCVHDAAVGVDGDATDRSLRVGGGIDEGGEPRVVDDEVLVDGDLDDGRVGGLVFGRGIDDGRSTTEQAASVLELRRARTDESDDGARPRADGCCVGLR